MSDSEPLDLEPGRGLELDSAADGRPRIPEPLPVRLVAVGDMVLPGQVGLEVEMDRFYRTLLGFERLATEEGWEYRADNFKVRFEPQEGLIERETYRPLQVEVNSLRETEEKLIVAEMEYTRQRGLLPAQEGLVVRDPSGNWVEIVESRRIV